VAEPADVLIIGAGASGGVAALRLAEAGYDVVCLEQGSWPDPSDYPGAGAGWELTARKAWSDLPNVRRHWADYPIDESGSDLAIANFNGVGGGTVVYAAVWPRLLPYDFRTRSLAGVGDDWPLSYEELQPYYDRVDRAFGASGLGGNPSYPPGEDPPLPPLPIGQRGLLLARAHARMGWHWWPDVNAILSAPYGGRHVCVQRGVCASGCGEGAKGSTDVTHWPAAVALGVQLVTGARVRRITLDERGRASGAEWVDAEGREHFQAAAVVLCASNGIGTPRLLLASTSPRFPDGLANSSGLVGRRLMLHPNGTVVGWFDEPLDSWQGHAGSGIQSLQFYGPQSGADFAGGSKWSLGGTGGPVGHAMGGRKGPVLGAAHHADMAARFGRGARWLLLCEDQAEDTNRVELSATLTDTSGLAAPKVTYRISENSRRILAWNSERAEESLREAGAVRVDVEPLGRQAHLMGTARMGDDPRTSVVDRWCMSHDVPNLGIIDGSVFVTAGAVNPTPTICALALRAVEHLIEQRGAVPAARPSRVRTVPVTLGPTPPAAVPSAPTVLPSAIERAVLRGVADIMVPAVDGIPAAGELGVADHLLDWVLGLRPDLSEPLRRALAGDGGDPADRLRHLEAADRAAFDALVLVVLAGYYHDAGVRDRIGYPGQVPRPVQARDYPEYLSEGLLDGVTAPG
jgi:choline dehydrogenase-like flavoprotein